MILSAVELFRSLSGVPQAKTHYLAIMGQKAHLVAPTQKLFSGTKHTTLVELG